jgi:hypothetical protein
MTTYFACLFPLLVIAAVVIVADELIRRHGR